MAKGHIRQRHLPKAKPLATLKGGFASLPQANANVATILATAGSKGLCLFAAGKCKCTFIRPFAGANEWANEGSEGEGGSLANL